MLTTNHGVEFGEEHEPSMLLFPRVCISFSFLGEGFGFDNIKINEPLAHLVQTPSCLPLTIETGNLTRTTPY